MGPNRQRGHGHGTAIIASERVGAAADLVREGENGHVVPTANIAALADALCRVLADRERCRAMVSAAARSSRGGAFAKTSRD